jgi:hypothetical protein
MPASVTAECSICKVLVGGLQGTGIQILAPGQDQYQESLVRWSDAAEKKAVCED